jgi:LacI family transcriptional regulator, galactose operon repressor
MSNRRATSADVARLAGVSRTTVSFVLNDRADARIGAATRKRVLEAADRLGYRPHASARHLAAGTTHTLALVLQRSAEQAAMDPLLPEMLRGLTESVGTLGYRVQLESLGEGSGAVLDLVRSREVDGVIVSGPRLEDPGLAGLEDPANAELPIVIHGSLPGSGLPSIDVDNFSGARQAVEQLIGLGHQRIACICSARMGFTSAQERRAGYRSALAEAGLPTERSLEASGDFEPASGSQAMSDLLEREVDFSAVFVASDSLALGAIAALRAAARNVPGDVSVVGFDDIPLAAYVDPPLTTVRVPARDLGGQAGRLLIDRLNAVAVPARTLLATRLIVRGSAAAPAAIVMGR